MKIVFDTNVILSAFLTQGLSSRVLDLCLDGHRLFISEWIITETTEKLKTKFKVPASELIRTRDFLMTAFEIIEPGGPVPDLCRDRDDNNILHLAEECKADLIITGDRDLLVLKVFQNCRIIDPRTYMEEYHRQ